MTEILQHTRMSRSFLQRQRAAAIAHGQRQRQEAESAREESLNSLAEHS